MSRCIVVIQDSRVDGKKFGSFPSNFFTQPFQYFKIVNLVDCLPSWYKFIMNNPSNIRFANFIVRTRISIVIIFAMAHQVLTQNRKLSKYFGKATLNIKSLNGSRKSFHCPPFRSTAIVSTTKRFNIRLLDVTEQFEEPRVYVYSPEHSRVHTACYAVW
jgi:hypothetical protein